MHPPATRPEKMLATAAGELLSGHTLKHLVAAAAALPAIVALHRLGARHNARQEAAHRPLVRAAVAPEENQR